MDGVSKKTMLALSVVSTVNVSNWLYTLLSIGL